MSPLRRIAPLALLLAAGSAQAQSDQVKVTSVWARATVPRAEVGAVYMTLTAPAADRLIAVSTPAAARAGMHEMTTEGGVMRMRELPALLLPGGQPVVLGPGGTHIMLTGLKAPLKQGQTVQLHLTFASAPPVDVVATVQGIGAAGPSKPR